MNPSPKRVQPAEKRQSLRLDTVFPVWITSSEHGEQKGVARNVSAGGIFIETAEPLPLGARVRVHFALPQGEASVIVARGEVKNHYFLNYADGPRGPRSIAGMGVGFLGFEADGQAELEVRLRGSCVLH